MNFSRFLKELYLNQYNKSEKILKKQRESLLVTPEIVLKIPIINCEDLVVKNNEEIYWEFYQFLKDFYLVNLSEKDEIKLSNPKKKGSFIKEKLTKKRGFDLEQKKFEFLMKIPKNKETFEILFKKGFYFELQCAKIGL